MTRYRTIVVDPPRWVTDKCLQCGRFVGRYPVGFHCDRHCAKCICATCPGVDGPGVYTVVTDAWGDESLGTAEVAA